jgi:hypothetical protein
MADIDMVRHVRTLHVVSCMNISASLLPRVAFFARSWLAASYAA